MTSDGRRGRHRIARALRTSVLGVLAGCAEVTGPTPRPLPGVPAAYPGFDLAVYPGDGALRTWRDAAPYEWIGFYLSAPCHRDASFGGRRRAIDAAGYGLAVLYVGQQTWEGVPSLAPVDGTRLSREGLPAAAAPATSRTARLWAQAQSPPTLAGPTCSRTLLSAAQGAAEGDDAVAKTAAEGFQRGTAVFLDLEPMTAVPEAMRSYYRAWVRTLLADGRYRPGVYVHHRNAAAVHTDVRALYAEFGAGRPAVWVARSAGFALDRGPADSGFDFAAVWQGALDVARTWGGVTLTIDENVASRRSPSAP